MTALAFNQEFLSAIQAGDADAVIQLLAAGANPDVVLQSEPALTVAVDRGHAAVVAVLIRAGACLDAVDNRFFSALHVAIIKKRFDIADMLLEAGADINVQRNPGFSSSPLHTAIYCDIKDDTTQRTAYLLGKGADINRQAWVGTGYLKHTGDALAQAKALDGGEKMLQFLVDYLQRRIQQQTAQRLASLSKKKKYRL